jgi:hypothetical protein
MDQVAIVILNYNGKHLLSQFLPSVVQHSFPHRIVVIDNASTDDSVAFIHQHYPQIQCIKLNKNEGFARGYNLGLQKIKAHYYVLLNLDVEVTPQWIAPILALMEDKPYIAACQPKILSYQDKSQFEYAGAGGGFIDILGYPFCRGRLFDTIEQDQGQYDDIREVFWASGACLFVRAKVFWDLGGFDENLFAYYEEIDFCWRLQQKDLKVYYCGFSQVYHLGSATIGTHNPYKTYLKFRNRALVLYKNTPKHFLAWKHGLRLLLDLLAAIKELLQGRGNHGYAILKAQIDFFKLKSHYTPPIHKYSLNNVYRGILPFAYFVQGKRSFNKIASYKFQPDPS